MLKDIGVVALMLQSYLVTENDNRRLNCSMDVFRWLVNILECSITKKLWHHFNFAVVEVVKVR